MVPKHHADDDKEGWMCHACGDDSLSIMRDDPVHFLCPFSTQHAEDKTWALNVVVDRCKTDQCFPKGFLATPQFRNGNTREAFPFKFLCHVNEFVTSQ
jgi:hypothetical protein